jgi:hypothetical protein
MKRTNPTLALPEVPRNPFSYVMAPFFGFAGAAGGAAASMMVMVAIMGMLAAIAIPNFIRYQERAKAAREKTIQIQQQNEEMEKLLQKSKD